MSKKKLVRKPNDLVITGCLFEVDAGCEKPQHGIGWPDGIYSSLGRMRSTEARKLSAWLVKAAYYLESLDSRKKDGKG